MSSENVDYQKDIYRGETSPVVQRHAKKSEDYHSNEHLPWHQQPGETGQAYAAFMIYLDIGPGRTQKTVSKVIYGQDSPSAKISQWSIDHDWVNRADAWDKFLAETHIANMEEAVRRAEEHGIRHLHAVTIKLTNAALGHEKIPREQARMIVDFMDRFGPAKQRAQQAINVNNYNVNSPSLPKEVTANLLNVEDADYEVLQAEASDLIPKQLKK